MVNVYKKEYESGRFAWYADFRVRGKRYRKKLDAQNKAQAKSLAQKLYNDVVNNQYELLGKNKSMTLKKLSEEYIQSAKMKKRSWDRDELSLSHILNMEVDGKKLGEYNIEDITPKHILTYQEKRKRELDAKFDAAGDSQRDRNYASINREIACLKHIFYLAIDWEYTEKNPVARRSIKMLPEIRRERFLSEAEIGTLLNAAEGHTYQIICFGLNTGMRLGEILSLKWKNIDIRKGVIQVRHTKTNKDRDVPINSFLSSILASLDQSGEYLFTYDRTGQRLQSIKKSFATALSKAQIDDFRFHDLRHTFSSYLAMGGVEENTRAELLGHAKRTMTSTYTHASWKRKMEAVEIMGNLCGQYLDIECENG